MQLPLELEITEIFTVLYKGSGSEIDIPTMMYLDNTDHPCVETNP